VGVERQVVGPVSQRQPLSIGQATALLVIYVGAPMGIWLVSERLGLLLGSLAPVAILIVALYPGFAAYVAVRSTAERVVTGIAILGPSLLIASVLAPSIRDNLFVGLVFPMTVAFALWASISWAASHLGGGRLAIRPFVGGALILFVLCAPLYLFVFMMTMVGGPTS
jgi:hypothetical protein